MNIAVTEMDSAEMKSAKLSCTAKVISDRTFAEQRSKALPKLGSISEVYGMEYSLFGDFIEENPILSQTFHTCIL